MRLVSFVRDGRASFGAIEDDGVRDVGAVMGPAYPDLRSVLADDEGLSRLREALPDAPRVDVSTVAWLPVIPNPSKIFCIGHNYEAHRVETGRPKTTFPAVFTRSAARQVGHDQEGWIPAELPDVAFEGELAVVIGRGGRRIARDQALAHVAGYACYDDLSVRDWQRHTSQFTPGKNFARTGAFGPWLVTADGIPDPQTLDLTTRVNGRVMQQANTARMIFRVDELIAYCSTFTPLEPGDVIVSGTPGGVGVRRDPPIFLAPGDVVEVEITGIGILRTRMVAEPTA